jgi:alpha-glucosidase (family GH31 glycosyl hydrolase)
MEPFGLETMPRNGRTSKLLYVGALSFVGADVGGFFGNTDAELLTRWMQA